MASTLEMMRKIDEEDALSTMRRIDKEESDSLAIMRRLNQESNLPRPDQPESTAMETAEKVVENIPPIFKRSVGGMAQAVSKQDTQTGMTVMGLDPRAGKLLKMGLESINRTIIGSLTGKKVETDQLGKFGKDLFDRATKDLEANSPNVDPNSLKGYGYDIAISLAQMAPALATTVATKSPTAGATVMGTQVYGDRYGQSVSEGRSPDQSHADATFFALAESIPEMIPLGIIMKPGQKFLPRIVGAMAAEGVQEMATEIMEAGYEAGILDEDMTWGDAWERVKRAGIVGAFVGGGMATAAHPFTGGPSETVETPVQEAIPEKAPIETEAETIKAESPEMAGNINLEKIHSPEEAKDVIRETAHTEALKLDESRRGTMSEVDTRELADAMGMTYEDLLKRNKGQAFNAETALASRNLLVQSAENVTKLAKSAVGGSDQSLAVFREAMLQHKAIQEQVAGMTAEAGRALKSFQYTAANEENRTKILKELIDSQGGRGKIEDLAKMVSEFETPEQVAKFIRDSEKATTSDMLLEVWINSLLSGPQTHAVNMLSNSLVSTWTLPENYLAAAFGTFRKSNKVYFSDAVARTYGWAHGWRDGIKLAAQAIKTGEPSDVFSKIETAHPKAIKGPVGEIVRIPGRLLQAEDELFKGVGYRMELQSLAVRTGLDNGLRGRKLAQFVQDTIQNPPENLHLAAIDNARYQTFTKPLGKLGRGVQDIAAHHPIMRVVFPFIRTPSNIIKFAGERSPIAPLFHEFRVAMRQGGAARDIALARMTMGTGIGAALSVMASEGFITGGGPDDPAARAAKYNTGWQPYSIKIGDKYYAYGRLEPLGMLMGIAADYAEIAGELKDAEKDEIAGRIMFAVSKNLTSKTWLRGLSEMIQAVEDPDRYGERYIQNLAGTVVPTGVAQIARVQDPVLRDTQTVLERIKSRIPGYSKTIPARRNIWGEPITLSGGVGPDLISPIYTSEIKDDKVNDEILRLKVNLTLPDRNIRGVKMDSKRYWEYVELAGKPAKEILDGIVSSPAWDTMPNYVKKEFIKDTVTKLRANARKQMIAKYPDIVEEMTKMELEKLE